MANSIKFDSVEILNATYIPQFMKHETVADRLLTSLPLTRQDGSVLIADRWGTKVITLRGTLIATDQNALDVAIDSFNELFSRQEKNLDISWNGSTRRYVATCTRHTYDRDHYNTNALPWTAEFTVLSGEGKDIVTTTVANAVPLTTDTPVTTSFSLLGSKAPKPYIKIKFTSFTNTVVNGIEYEDVDTGEKIIINKQDIQLSTGEYFVIDCLTKKVLWTQFGTVWTELPFYGVFPKFKVGTNNIKISVASIDNQSILNDVAGAGGFTSFSAGTDRFGQSFSIPYTDSTFSYLTLEMKVHGAPGDFLIRIETDNNGSPSGVLADANATNATTSAWILTQTGGADLWGFVKMGFIGNVKLSADTKYWIVIANTGTSDASNYYAYGIGKTYPKGLLKESTDSGATYSVWPSTPLAFALLYGGFSTPSTIEHTVTYTKTYL